MPNIRFPLQKNCFLFAATALFYCSYLSASSGSIDPKASDFVQLPPLASNGAEPFAMISLSVELTQQAEAYTGAAQTFPNGTYCPGRSGGIDYCYTHQEDYVGYFDHKKCYKYVRNSDPTGSHNVQVNTGALNSSKTNYFEPSYAADARKECNGDAFSGNFLNWASMTAIDEFRFAMTGGARITDTAGNNAKTILTRAHRNRKFNAWGFVEKRISTSTSGLPNFSPEFNVDPQEVTPPAFNVDPQKVTPFKPYVIKTYNRTSGDLSGTYNITPRQIFIRNNKEGNQIEFLNDYSQNLDAPVTNYNLYHDGYGNERSNWSWAKRTEGIWDNTFNVAVEVCNRSVGLEPNCAEYSDGTKTWYKPEGEMQALATRMRFGLTTYSAFSASKSAPGAGFNDNAINGGVLRANAKFIGPKRPGPQGELEVNPRAEVNEYGQFVNHPDKFKTGENASDDLLGTDYGDEDTEVVNSGIINYINAFGLTENSYKVFDPVSELYYESLRYIMGLGRTKEYIDGDGGSLPHLKGNDYDGFPAIKDWKDPIVNSCQANLIVSVGDQFSWADTDLPGTHRPSSAGRPSGAPDYADYASLDVPEDLNVATLTDKVGKLERMTDLKSKSTGRGNSYFAAGMSYWATTEDVRPANHANAIDGKQTVDSFFIDTAEFNWNPPAREGNPLWMAGKYGGFDDFNGDGDPHNGNTPSQALTSAERNRIAELTIKGNLTAAEQTEVDNIRLKCGSTDEWDSDGDCEPNTYALANAPHRLIKALKEAFVAPVDGLSAGSSAGLINNTADGQGIVVQGLYNPNTVIGDQSVKWTGILQALFIDQYDNFREDTDQDGKVTDNDYILEYHVDDLLQRAYVMRYKPTTGTSTDPFTGETRSNVVLKGQLVDNSGGNPVDAPTFPYDHDSNSGTPDVNGYHEDPAFLTYMLGVDEIAGVWNARDALADLENVVDQREYKTVADSNGGRYIFTSIADSIDPETKAVITKYENQLAFTAENFPAASDADPNDPKSVDNNYRHLGLNSLTGDQAPDIVNFIRGKEGLGGYRSRLIDFDDDGEDEVWRLGDIISSAPLVVGTPDKETRFDLKYGDASYEAFYQKYRERRQVAYVGANDGMIHAFNAGFFRQTTQGIDKRGNNFRTPHELGAELWSYVPSNLLPHLQWLTDPEYKHVPYVEGVPQVFDVNIFPQIKPYTYNGDYPVGWGSILVVGTGFGGSDITYDPNSDYDADTSDDHTTRSSFVVLDVTNPETPPVLLAEITHPEMGFTISRPTVIKARLSDGGVYTSGNDKWYLVFGSGPRADNATDRIETLKYGSTNTDTQTGRIFFYDLQAKTFAKIIGIPANFNGFTGGLTAVDWDNDYIDDAIYFGSTRGDFDNPGGDIWRLELGKVTSPNKLQDLVEQAKIKRLVSRNRSYTKNNETKIDERMHVAFTGKPHVVDQFGEYWVYTGSGKYLTTEDGKRTRQNYFMGILEPKDPITKKPLFASDSPQKFDELIDVSDIGVEFVSAARSDDSLINSARIYDKTVTARLTPPIIGGSEYKTLGELRELIQKSGGWKIKFADKRARHVGKADGTGFITGFTEYTPGESSCDPFGSTAVNAVYYATGTALSYSPLLNENTVTFDDGEVIPVAKAGEPLTQGLVRDVDYDSIATNRFGGLEDKFKNNQPSTGSKRMSWREILIDW